jgi:hypothetical protein
MTQYVGLDVSLDVSLKEMPTQVQYGDEDAGLMGQYVCA